MGTDLFGEPIVFLGPTMPVGDARGLLNGRFLPPARNGDVLRALVHDPSAIVIIDGYFNWVPSVWHKEILYALDRGVPVYGTSSMGALRAAELDQFGMIGSGMVYEGYRSGRLTDDDEVAVMHGDAESDYRAMSDAMVNVRATIDDAIIAGVLDAESGAGVVDHIKAEFFPDRNLGHFVTAQACSKLLGRSATVALRQWLQDHWRDVKREDAEALLTTLACDGVAPVGSASFDFQPTSNWLRLAAAVGHAGIDDHDDTALHRAVGRHDDLLTECRLSGQWPLLEAAAIAQLEAGAPGGLSEAVTQVEVDEELARLCIALGLADAADIEIWMSAHAVTWHELIDLAGREVRMSRLRARHRAGLPAAIRDVLLLTGQYGSMTRRSAVRRHWMTSVDGRRAPASRVDDVVGEFRDHHGLSPGEPAWFMARRHGWDDADDMVEDLIVDHHVRQFEGAAAVGGGTLTTRNSAR
jgi:hypothetical protein